MAASRKSAARKAAKTRKSQASAKKAVKTRKRNVAGKKAAAAGKRPGAAGKAAAGGKTKAAARAIAQRRPSETPPAITEIENRIAIARDNLRELVEQAASSSGAANEELMAQRIAEQEAKLALLRKQREEAARLSAPARRG